MKESGTFMPTLNEQLTACYVNCFKANPTIMQRLLGMYFLFSSIFPLNKRGDSLELAHVFDGRL